MNNKSGGKGKIGIGLAIIVICIAALIVVGVTAPSFFAVLGWLLIIVVVLMIVAFALLLFFASRASNKKAAETRATSVNKEQLTKEQSDLIQKARSDLLAIRMVNSKIKDSEITEAASNVCSSAEKNLQTLKEKPEKIQTNRQLFSYYLPTLRSVLTKYQTLEAGGAETGDMPANLKNYLTDVNTALTNQYNSLFDNDKLNVEVDMEAMTMAIKRDGLLDDEADFKL